MHTNRRQLVVLGAILAVLAIVLVWQATRRDQTPEEYAAAMRETAAAGPPGLTAAAPVPAAAPARPARPLGIPAVQLDKLGREQPEPADSGRDPFRFGSGAPSERQRNGSAAPGGERPSGPPAQAGPPAAPLEPPGPPPPPPIALKFIGIARQGTGRLYAVLRDDRGIYYGADGDIVEGRYRILRVTSDMVEVSYVDGRGRVNIPLSGGRP